MSIFIGGTLDGSKVPEGTKGDFKNKGEIYFVREYWKRDGIGGTVHAIRVWVSNSTSDKNAVFKIEQHLRLTS
jgi:hypothetical protein